MSKFILTPDYYLGQQNRPANNFDANNKLVGKLAEIAIDWNASYSNIITTPTKGTVLFNLYPDGDRTKKITVIMNGKLKAAHLESPFTVPELLALPIFESYYDGKDGKRLSCLTIQTPSSGIPDNELFAFNEASLVDAIKAATVLATA